MKGQIIGIRSVDFTDSSTGKAIVGTTMYVGKKNPYVRGLEPKKIFLNSSIDCSEFKVNDMVDVSFNEYGKVDSISLDK